VSKYHSKRTNGYASKLEANTAAGLSALARAGKIQDFKEQVTFVLVQGKDKVRAITYIADFTYWDENGYHVCDAKGYRTEVYRIKRKLLYLLHGITVEEL